MKDYFEFVEKLACDRENKIFFNSGPIHASIVMSRIFSYSEKEILILSGGFSGAISNDPVYLTTLDCFLQKTGTILKVIVEEYEKYQNSKIYAIFKKHKEKVTLYQTDSKLISAETKKNIHFTVGDNRMLRIETNPEDFTAEVNFNSPNAPLFVDFFNKIIEIEEKTKSIAL